MAATTDHDQSLSELARSLTDQTTRLARQEVELAKAELSAKARQAGAGAGMFGGTGLFGLFAFGALTATFILALATAVAPWLAALIVALLYGAVAGVLAMSGKSRVQRATPPVPEQAIQSTRQDLQVTKQRFKAARS